MDAGRDADAGEFGGEAPPKAPVAAKAAAPKAKVPPKGPPLEQPDERPTPAPAKKAGKSLEQQLAESQARAAEAERKLAERASRKPGACAWTSKGNHEADRERIRANREAVGEDPDAPMFVSKDETRAEYRRFAKNNQRSATFMQPVPQAAPVPQEAPRQRQGKRTDRTGTEA